MTYLRKLLNQPTSEQFGLLERDAERILAECNKIARDEIEDQLHAKEMHDGTCPNAKCKSTNIVTKKVSVKNKFSDINHCNNCGTEWEKFKTKKISRTAILRVALKYLKDILKNPDERNYQWKAETVKMFEDSYAETIFNLNRVKSGYMFPEIKLSELRKKYKSVFS